MPIFQGTLFFEQGSYGWTESLFISNSDSYTNNLLKLQSLAQKRIACCGTTVKIKATRISDTAIFRDVLGASYTSLVGTQSDSGDASFAALLVRMRAAGFTVPIKNLFFRGIPDQIVLNGGTYQPNAEFLAAFNAWAAQIFADSWGWMASVPSAPQAMTNAAVQVNGTWIFTLGAAFFAPPFNVKGKVRVSGVLGAVGLNRTHNVQIIDATHAQTLNPVWTAPYGGGGFLTQSTRSFVPATVVQGMRIVERKPGRPSYLSRGRRPARRAS